MGTELKGGKGGQSLRVHGKGGKGAQPKGEDGERA